MTASPEEKENGEPVLLMGVDFVSRRWLVVDRDGNATMVDLPIVTLDWRWVAERDGHSGQSGPGWLDLDDLIEDPGESSASPTDTGG